MWWFTLHYNVSDVHKLIDGSIITNEYFLLENNPLVLLRSFAHVVASVCASWIGSPWHAFLLLILNIFGVTLYQYRLWFSPGIQFALMSAWVPEPKPIVTFTADHPFIIGIISRTRDLLFLGRLSKPWVSLLFCNHVVLSNI